jgi:hypothetical protein
MPPAITSAVVDALLGWTLGGADPQSGANVSIEGLSSGPAGDGALEIKVRKFTAASLRMASGAVTLEVGQLVLHDLVARLRVDEGKPRVAALEAASAELSGVKLHGPLDLSGLERAPAPAGAWSLGPLATAQGHVRAEIVDAHLGFDADVTVPILQGQVDFKDATVEHVGPDSRMGVSRLGIYVDAPNGRSYLYQFASAPVPGVDYERRGAMLGPWVTHRGSLQLQPFAEWLLRQRWEGQPMGVTEQSRLLFDRTAVSGEVRPGDGRIAAPGVQAELAGRAEGRNVLRLHSEAVGRGLTVDMPSLLVKNAVLGWQGTRVECGEISGALTLRLRVEGAQVGFEFSVAEMAMSGLRLALLEVGQLALEALARPGQGTPDR